MLKARGSSWSRHKRLEGELKLFIGLFFALVAALSTGCSADESRLEEPCGDEGYRHYCERSDLLLVCGQCGQAQSEQCWRYTGCQAGYECRYLILSEGEGSYEGARCLSPKDPQYPASTSEPQTFNK